MFGTNLSDCFLLLFVGQNGGIKGSTGSVRGLCRHPTQPLLFSVGLDRFLRVFDTVKRRQKCAVYLKQYTNALTLLPAQTSGSTLEQGDAESNEDVGANIRDKGAQGGAAPKRRKKKHQ